MYKIMVDGKRLHDTNTTQYLVEKPTLKLSANKLATLTFTIYENNPQYSQIQKMKSLIAVYRDDEVIALVRPVKTKLNFLGGIEYTCEDILARLNDIKRRPSYFAGTQRQYLVNMMQDFTARYTATIAMNHLGDRVLRNGSRGSDVRELQSALMQLGYNVGAYGADGIFGQLTEDAVSTFQYDHGLNIDGIVGTETANAILALITPDPSTLTDVVFTIGNTPHSDVESVEFINDDYVGYWELFQKEIIEKYGGYLVPRYTANTVTLDYLGVEDLTHSSQKVEYAENLSDLFVETDGADIFSVLIPLGADVEATGIHPGQAENTPLTIKSVTLDGVDYLENAEALAMYGRRETTMRWDDIDDPNVLWSTGLEYLEEHAVQLKEKITLSAVDLKYANVNTDYLSFMDLVEVRSVRHSVVAPYPLTEMQLSLDNPTSSKFTLGDEQLTLTDRVTGNATSANQMYSALSGRVFNLENRS